MMIIINYILSFWDKIDGEFSRVKDALVVHNKRHNSESGDYVAVTDSQSFVEFGEKFVSSPGPKSGIRERKFSSLKKEEIDERVSAKPDFKTLNGIKSVYQYICRSSGEVMWRKLPCFCTKCSSTDWESCPNTDTVGKLKVVINPGDDF